MLFRCEVALREVTLAVRLQGHYGIRSMFAGCKVLGWGWAECVGPGG